MRVKMVVAYDGTNYSGWQIQPNGVTIEQKLNEALQALLGEDIRVTGASYRGAGFLRSAGYLSSTFFQKPKDL